MGIYLWLPSTRRRSAWPSIPVTMLLVVLGIITQIGATLYQWSIGVIGLAVGNSLNMGTMLSASVILGLVVLKERVTWRCIAAIMLVSAAVFLFSPCGRSAGNKCHRHRDVRPVGRKLCRLGA